MTMLESQSPLSAGDVHQIMAIVHEVLDHWDNPAE